MDKCVLDHSGGVFIVYTHGYTDNYYWITEILKKT